MPVGATAESTLLRQAPILVYRDHGPGSVPGYPAPINIGFGGAAEMSFFPAGRGATPACLIAGRTPSS